MKLIKILITGFDKELGCQFIPDGEAGFAFMNKPSHWSAWNMGRITLQDVTDLLVPESVKVTMMTFPPKLI